MTWPDIVNSIFESAAGIFVLLHCRKVMIDKDVAGVSILSVIFFTSWGFWNLFYYPHLNQIASFFGGLLIVVANSIWVCLLLKYRRRS